MVPLTARAAFGVFLPATLSAQLIVSRNIVPLTLADASPTGFLSRVEFYGEAQRGFASEGEELAWDVKLLGLLELYRWASRTSLVALVGHELNANPHNSIGFNPRGAIWEETVFLVRRGGSIDWHLGAFHRCRHEIDNTHPPDESAPNPSYVPTARLLSLTGAHAGIAGHPISLGDRGTISWFLRGERYATATDNRTPRNSEPPYWKRANAALGGGARIRGGAASDRALYASGWGSAMFFSGTGSPSEFQWRAEAGARLPGRGGSVDLFVAYERMFDDVTRPVPQRSGVLGLGVRFGPR
jgi:hypothetical protein